jgi:hypothetical protein
VRGRRWMDLAEVWEVGKNGGCLRVALLAARSLTRALRPLASGLTPITGPRPHELDTHTPLLARQGWLGLWVVWMGAATLRPGPGCQGADAHVHDRTVDEFLLPLTLPPLLLPFPRGWTLTLHLLTSLSSPALRHLARKPERGWVGRLRPRLTHIAARCHLWADLTGGLTMRRR